MAGDSIKLYVIFFHFDNKFEFAFIWKSKFYRGDIPRDALTTQSLSRTRVSLCAAEHLATTIATTT